MMSLAELEALEFDWNSVFAGNETTRCCATGTCVINSYSQKVDLPQISSVLDSKNPFDLQGRFGLLREKIALS